MSSYGQFCSIARALDLLGERWTLLVVRELLCGSSRFNEIRRGIPRISRTMLAARLKDLTLAGVATRIHTANGPIYRLTEGGSELAGVVRELGIWGQRWLPRTLRVQELDADTLLWDIRRRVRMEALPEAPIVVRIELADSQTRRFVRFLLLRRSEVSICSINPGFPEEISIQSTVRTLTAWWRGDISLSDARAEGMLIQGSRHWTRAFPTWFERYAFANVTPRATAQRKTLGSRHPSP